MLRLFCILLVMLTLVAGPWASPRAKAGGCGQAVTSLDICPAPGFAAKQPLPEPRCALCVVLPDAARWQPELRMQVAALFPLPGLAARSFAAPAPWRPPRA